MVSKRHKLCFSFDIPFCTLISLWTYLLQILGCVYGKTWYALCATYIERLCWCFAHLCISLLKCLPLSHPSIFGWASLYLSLLSLVAQHFLVASCFASFLSLSLLALVCVSKWSKREWGFHVVHTIVKCKSYFVHVPWGVSSWFLEHLVDLIIISSCVQLFFGSFDCLPLLLRYLSLWYFVAIFGFSI